MITSLQVRLFVLAIHWPSALTGLRALSLSIGMLLAGSNGTDQHQFSSLATGTVTSEAPALIKQLEAVEIDSLLTVIGQALCPFACSANSIDSLSEKP